MQPQYINYQPQCCLAGVLPTTPALQATDAGGNVDGSLIAGQGQGLSKGTIAGIVLGSIAAATLLTTLIAFIVVKVHWSAMSLVDFHSCLHDTVSSDACLISAVCCSSYIIVPSQAEHYSLAAVSCGAWLQTMGSGGHKRLQETPSSKAWVHKSSMDRQVEMTKAADAKEAQNDLFSGPRSSTDFNIKASL